MKCASVVKAAAAVVIVVGLAGCVDLKPLQAQVDDLKSQVAALKTDTAGAKSAADAASSIPRPPRAIRLSRRKEMVTP